MSARERTIDELLADHGATACALKAAARGTSEQTFATIAPYTIEEAYEVADAIERRQSGAAVAMSSAICCSRSYSMRAWRRRPGQFEFADVVAAICDKLTRRHPHVFGAERIASSADQSRAWEEHKKRERAAAGGNGSILDGIPLGTSGADARRQGGQARGQRRFRLARLARGARQDR